MPPEFLAAQSPAIKDGTLAVQEQTSNKTTNAITGPVDSSPTTTANASTDQSDIELARLKLSNAEESAKVAQKQYEVGRIDQLELEKALADRDMARAELNGDAVEVARIQLRIAEMELSVTQKRYDVGTTSAEEVRKAKLAYDQAVVVLRQKQAESGK